MQFILSKLRFHRLRREFNGLFEYEEYVTLKGIDDPNEGRVFYPSFPKVVRSPSGYSQLRDHFRSHAIARPNRLVPEDGLLAFQALNQQRMQNLSLGSAGERKLGNLSIHHKHAAGHVST